VLFFHDFLSSRGVKGGMLLDLGCGSGRNAVHFARAGFEVHAVDIKDMRGLEAYGVRAHCHSVTGFWLFENASFEFASDVFCYHEEPDAGKRAFYRGELGRVLKGGGYFLLSVPAASRERVEREFSGFEIVGFEESKDTIGGKEVRAISFIMRL
jgi:SAM-dependent methyltransferase